MKAYLNSQKTHFRTLVLLGFEAGKPLTSKCPTGSNAFESPSTSTIGERIEQDSLFTIICEARSFSPSAHGADTPMGHNIMKNQPHMQPLTVLELWLPWSVPYVQVCLKLQLGPIAIQSQSSGAAFQAFSFNRLPSCP
jgi:hypothetical protein